jgi:hypothetical protein
MKPVDLEKWRNEVLSRLEALKVRARQIQQLMDAHNLRKLEDKLDFEAAWEQIEVLFPEDLHPNRAGDLGRHIYFAERHDFSDIEAMDIPAVMESVQRYGRKGEAFIVEEVERLQFSSSVSDLIHPQIKDACSDLITGRQYREAARTVVGLVMDELRRLSRVESDGDPLVRKAIGTEPGKLAFSDCRSPNARQVTEGLKLITQGLYKGVRNPASHGWNAFGRVEVLQIMATCSILLTQLQLVKAEEED